MKIKTKADMYVLYERGAFGNKLCTWRSVEDAIQDGHQKICIRNKQPGNKRYAFGIDVEEARTKISEWKREGCDPSFFAFNEVGPDDLLCLQGEVRRSEQYIELTGSEIPGVMHRDAIRNHGYSCKGLAAVLILKRHLSPSSYDDIMELLEQYPDAVIEFSTYLRDVGSCRNRNTIIWEVRDY